MMLFDENSLQQRALSDLTNRARGGIVIYLLAWLVIMLPNQVQVKTPHFFYFNTAILILLLLARLGHYYCHLKRPDFPHRLSNDWLVWTILLGALHWGLMSFWCMTTEALVELRTYMTVTSAVLGIAGTTALSISRRIRLLFPLFMMVPAILALLLRSQAEDLIFAAMAVLALVYVAVTSKTASQDYWQAIRNRVLAEQRAREMEKLSITDPLTQLNNRSYFDRRFSEEWKRGDRQQSELSLLLLDLDHFKSLNDTHGHVFGDHCLQQVAATLTAEIHRETDILARYGGEEFLVLMPDTDASEAASMAQRLLSAVSDIELERAEATVRMTCSIGIATILPDHRKPSEELLKQADHALYQAKNDGRNCYRTWQPQLLETANA